MGNFYTNFVIASDEADRVADALGSRGRRAYLASAGGKTFVYDELCEKQDLDELRGLAKVLSTEARAPVLAACNHDDDILWLALADLDSVIEVYNSDPEYFGDGTAGPEIHEVSRLCDAFGVPDRSSEVTALLKATREDFVFEIERHEKLLDILGVSSIGLAGFNYLQQDGLPDPDVVLRAIGDAPLPPAPAATEPMPGKAASPSPPSPERLAQVNEMRALATALMLGEARIPAGVEPILPEGRLKGLLALQRVQQYIGANGLILMSPPQSMRVRADAALQRLLGVDDFPLQDLTRLVVEKLDVWSSFSPEEIEAIKAGSPEMIQRQQAAARQLLLDLTGKFSR